ncbi:protein phosphatase 2C domain-containing protein, partial [Streptomyces clavuligerus]
DGPWPDQPTLMMGHHPAVAAPGQPYGTPPGAPGPDAGHHSTPAEPPQSGAAPPHGAPGTVGAVPGGPEADHHTLWPTAGAVTTGQPTAPAAAPQPGTVPMAQTAHPDAGQTGDPGGAASGAGPGGPAPDHRSAPGGPQAARPAPGQPYGTPPGAGPQTAHPDPGRTTPGGDPRDGDGVPTAPVPVVGPVCVLCRAGRVGADGYCGNCGHARPAERDHQELELSSVAAVSDRGLRHHRNEDAFAVSTTALPDGSPAVIAIVCDGVSSASRPDEASRAAARAADELLVERLPRGVHPQQAMQDAIVAAAAAVSDLAGNTPANPRAPEAHHQSNAPACTIVGAISAGGLLVVGWVGDSRVYWVPDDRSQNPARLTDDDSWAAQMVAAGLMSEAEAYADERAHAITGWLGADAYELDPHTATFAPDRPGVVVVCTDGLWNYAESPRAMARAVAPDAANRPLHSARLLVGHALDGGGHDNITVAVLPFPVAVPSGTV